MKCHNKKAVMYETIILSISLSWLKQQYFTVIAEGADLINSNKRYKGLVAIHKTWNIKRKKCVILEATTSTEKSRYNLQ